LPRAWHEQRQLLQMAGQVWWDALSADYFVIACRVIDASLIAEMKDMAEQNCRLKKMYAEMSMQNDLLKEALGKKR
jgi:putative transposase